MPYLARLKAGVLIACTLCSPVLAGSPFCNNLGCKGECEEIDRCLCACFSCGSGSCHVTTAYFGELGYELMLFLPYVYYLHTQGMLDSSIGPLGSSPFYFFSKNHTEVDMPRRFCGGTSVNRNAHPEPGAFNFGEWAPPPLRSHYVTKGEGLRDKLRSTAGGSDKPLLIVHNKYTREWSGPPTNFIDVPTLLSLFQLLTPHYTCVYIRPHPTQHLNGYEFDHQTAADDFDDFEQLTAAKLGVIYFHDLLHGYPELSFNELQLRLHAQADLYISVLGGNAVLASYFAKTNLIFAKAGTEMRHYNLPDLHGDSYEYSFLYPKVSPGASARVLHMHNFSQLLTTAQEQYVPKLQPR